MSTLFIGLGTMGEPMARNLSRAAEIIVYDAHTATRDRIATGLCVPALPDLGNVPDGVDTVVLMVPDSHAVESLLVGDAALLDRLPVGALIIDMSSSDPASTRMLAKQASAQRIDYVDAPVSGGVTRARSGELSIIVGATDHAFERAQPILQAIGTSIHHVGGPGCGDAAKALNNLLSATNFAAVAEILTAAAAAGIAPALMLDVIDASTGRSQASEVKYPAEVLTGRFASGFGMDLMLKDLAIAASLTDRAAAPVTGAAHDIARDARALLGPGRDHTEIVRGYENASGLPLRNRRSPPRTT
ncbi:NAD(P)-dependent oxidoreductase [Microbacterium aurum]